jgi:hypothetical protein
LVVAGNIIIQESKMTRQLIARIITAAAIAAAALTIGATAAQADTAVSAGSGQTIGIQADPAGDDSDPWD